MTKRLIISGLILIFAMTVAGTSFAKFKCTVEKVDGTTMMLKDCNEKKAKKIKAGDTVSITKKKKRKALEGC